MRHQGPATRGQPGLEQLPVGDLLRHEHLARHVAAAGVELLDGRAQDGLGLGEAVEEVALARHDLAVPHREHLDRGPVTLHVGAEEVALLDVGGRDLLRGLQPLEGPHLVAQAGRLLEAVPAAAVSICSRSRRVTSSVRPSRKSRASSQRSPVAFERADLGHARREAALDLVLEARAGAAGR